MLSSQNIPYHLVSNAQLASKNIKLLVKRLDMIHPLVSGNKFYKLKYNIEAAKKAGYTKILTFGGAYSNHIHACAEAARLENMDIIGIIRGEETLPLNPTLECAEICGMTLQYLSRSEYRQKTDPSYLERLRQTYGDFYLIPEGGTNSLAIQGTKEMLSGEDFRADIIACCVGTGGTMAGIVSTAKKNQKVWGFSSLKGEFIKDEFRNLLDKEKIQPDCSYEIITDYHFGGYGKHKSELLDFMESFYMTTDIPLDPIYTAKMMFGIFDRLDRIKEGSTLLCIHSGGLQGIAGFNQRFGTSLPAE